MKEIEEMYPEEIKTKSKEISKMKKDDDLKFLKLKITYGNTCKIAYPGASELNDRDARRKYTVTAFVDLGLSAAASNNLIREVVFQFSPFYYDIHKVVNKWPYQIYTNNFKSDCILCIIKWNDHLKMKDLVLYHKLSYDCENGGLTNVHIFKIKKTKAMKAYLPEIITEKSKENESKAASKIRKWR